MAAKQALRRPAEAPDKKISPKVKVLVADDFQDTLDILSHSLRWSSFEVITAANGVEALEKFRTEKPDVVVLDVMMPGMTGIEVCREIKQEMGGTFFPVLLLTAKSAIDAKVDGFEAGADDYITKPFDPVEVNARISSAVRTKRLQDELIRIREELRFVNHDLERRVFPGAHEPLRRKTLTILFSDIRNFTGLSDQLEPEEVQSILDEYVEEMGQAAAEHGGTIHKVLGDGVMVLFNYPDEQEDHRLRGARAALEMRKRSRSLEARFHTRLPEPFSVGIGLHTGEAVVGRLGHTRVHDVTAVGSAVNLAARLQSLGESGQIIATFDLYGAIGRQVVIAGERREEIRGLAHPVKLAEIIGLRP